MMISRRTFASMALAMVAALSMVGCGNSGGDETAKAGGDTKETGGAKTLTVAAFKGGYDIDFYAKAGKEFEAKNPGLKVEVTGDPRVWEKLRPMFVSGSPPDLTFPGWGMNHWELIEEGQIAPLDKALDEKPYEGDGTWRDTFVPSILKMGQVDGKQYMLPLYVIVMGWWCDPGVFKKNGWTPPKTYEELLTLCEKIKAKGIAPITYQGKYPYYMIDGMLLPWAFSAGGAEAVRDAQNLVPGAWKSPAMLKAAQMIAELQSKGYFQKGATGMSHTEAQTEFVNGRAAMAPCGNWISAEMKASMPPGAALEFFAPPVLKDGKGDPTNCLIKIEPWMVPTKSKHPKEATDFYKYMTSLTKAKEFVKEKGTLMAIKGSDQVEMPEVLKAPAKLYRDSKAIWACQYREWYPEFNKEIENSLTAMLNGELTPEKFCDRVEAAAEKTRNNGDIKKHKAAM